MDAFRGGDEDLRRVTPLFFALGGGGITRTYFYPPIEAQGGDGSFRRNADLFGQGPDRGDPNELQALVFVFLKGFQ